LATEATADLVVSSLLLQAAERHAEFTKEDGHHYVRDLGTTSGTWLNDKRMDARAKKMLRPGDVLEFGQPGTGLRYKIKVRAIVWDTVLSCC
jgi:pSer/pThr/pTyr-binding forkhead associated (FHA) protein